MLKSVFLPSPININEKTFPDLSYLFKDGDDQEEIVKSGKKNLIIINSTGCETNLKLDGVKIHSRELHTN